MTAAELRHHFNTTYGIEKPWPAAYEVDAETYGHCCKAVFEKLQQIDNTEFVIHLSKNRNLMFKNVELLIKTK